MKHSGIPFFWVTLNLWILWIYHGNAAPITKGKDGKANHETIVQHKTEAIAGTVELNITRQVDQGPLEINRFPTFEFPEKELSRRKRFLLLEPRWLTKNLFNKISEFPKRTQLLGGRKRVDEEFERAFGIWENVSDLTLTRITEGNPHIDIGFGSGWHGYGCRPFDGQFGFLAHASPPSARGYIHFDDDEPCTIDSYDGINLFQIAVHEAGHELGINHSEVGGSVMTPRYSGYNPNFKLAADDIEAIQAHYGEKGMSPPETPTPSKTTMESTTTLPPKSSESTATTFYWLGLVIFFAVVGLAGFFCVGITIIINECRKSRLGASEQQRQPSVPAVHNPTTIALHFSKLNKPDKSRRSDVPLDNIMT